MIAKKSGLLILLAVMYSGGLYAAPQAQRVKQPQECAAVTKDDAQNILYSIESIVKEIRDCNTKNRAPRPGSPQACNPGSPVYQTIDLTPVLTQLCVIRNKVCDLLETDEDTLEKVCSMQDVLGDCTDESVLLPSIVDKEDIDDLCETVITLLKTILLELRGQFLTLP